MFVSLARLRVFFGKSKGQYNMKYSGFVIRKNFPEFACFAKEISEQLCAFIVYAYFCTFSQIFS